MKPISNCYEIEYYDVMYRKQGTTEWQEQFKYTEQANMEYLEPDTMYEFQVALVTEEGSTAYSEMEVIKTPAPEVETPPE